MKTAGWSTRCVAGQVDLSECEVRNCWKQWTREVTHAWKNRVWSDQEDYEQIFRRIMWQALVDPTVIRPTIRADVGLAIVPQTIFDTLRKQILKSKRLSVHSL
ncbi:uncharacterized protein TNCV_416471 [Trichonephila clavipes]|nr:uncharacterized protein TNCV_416471 [Trichonephila clavipes]